MGSVNFYIDGLNVYYGMLKGRPQDKWLDLRAWCESLTDHHTVKTVHYFTARVRAINGDHGPHVRQDRYLRALRAVGGTEIHEAHFVKEPSSAWKRDWSEQVDVWKIEEKCSDVNIGAHMLLDAMNGASDITALICNDSDLRVPVAMLMGPNFSREVWVFNPTRRIKSSRFKPSVHVDLRPNSLAAFQLPRAVISSKGRPILRPSEWAEKRGSPA